MNLAFIKSTLDTKSRMRARLWRPEGSLHSRRLTFSSNRTLCWCNRSLEERPRSPVWTCPCLEERWTCVMVEILMLRGLPLWSYGVEFIVRRAHGVLWFFLSIFFFRRSRKPWQSRASKNNFYWNSTTFERVCAVWLMSFLECSKHLALATYSECVSVCQEPWNCYGMLFVIM